MPPETLLSAPAPFRSRRHDERRRRRARTSSAPFELAATAEGDPRFRCFVVHFDTAFAPAGGVATSFTTAASATATHWKQTALYLSVRSRWSLRRRDHGHRRLRPPLGVQARVRLLGELRRQRRRDERAAVHDAVAQACSGGRAVGKTVQRVYKAATALPTRYSPGRGACRATAPTASPTAASRRPPSATQLHRRRPPSWRRAGETKAAFELGVERTTVRHLHRPHRLELLELRGGVGCVEP